jgi:DNA (cytosine-5)-methyltransferase 1
VTKPQRRPNLKLTFHKRSRRRSTGPTCIDLFSGAGGLAEGFRKAGWSIRSANDIDSGAGATFRLNFPEASFFEGPISGLSPKKLLRDAGLKVGQLDCLVGGPPCQSFSYNSHQRSARNARAQLFRDYLRIVKALKPKTLLMENVPGMLTIDGGRIVNAIRRALAALDYKSEIRILYAEDYGVPQTRRRAFVVASRIGEPSGVFPRGTHGPSEKPSLEANEFVHRWEADSRSKTRELVTVWEAIGDLPLIKSGASSKATRYRKAPKSEFQRRVRGAKKIANNHSCHDLTAALLKRIAHVPEGGNWRDIPRHLLTAGMRRARKSCHTKRYGRLSRRGLASTLLTKCDPHWGAYVHPTQNRTISVREAARLQGFPDHFRFSGSHIHKHYVQVGNAVPVPIGAAFGKSLKRHLRRAPSTKRPRAVAST